MTALYHHMQRDNFDDYGVITNPQLPDFVSFIKGALIRETLPVPLVFEVSHPVRAAVPHLLGNAIPLMSDYLVKTLRAAGVDNLQVFPAILKSKAGEQWEGWWAVNTLGLVAAADLEKSEYDTLMKGAAGGVEVPLLAFTKLVLVAAKTHDFSLFRLAESPSTLLIHDRLNKYLDSHDPPDGWGYMTTAIQTL